jgi:DNA-binding winged helix-turn-helix (wHTH) protein
VTKDQLLDEVWRGLVVEENNIAAQVLALRKALGRRFKQRPNVEIHVIRV